MPRNQVRHRNVFVTDAASDAAAGTAFGAVDERRPQPSRHDTTVSPGTRADAARSSLTRSRPWLRAIDAIVRSLAPIVVP